MRKCLPNALHGILLCIMGSICCCRTKFWAFYFCDTGRHILLSASVILTYSYCLLLWQCHTFIVYFCGSGIYLLSTFVTLVQIFVILLWHWYWYTSIFYFCDTATHLFSSFVTPANIYFLVLSQPYFLLLWHQHTFIVYFRDTDKWYGTHLLSTSLTFVRICFLLLWHWHTFIFIFKGLNSSRSKKN